MLHHGDNLEVMRRLHAEGERVHLAYLDPPFNTGRDFTFKPRGAGPEEHAYSDRWPSLEAFVEALRERVAVVRDLLTPDGTMVLHVDPETSHYVKVMLDGVFGRQCFANEIVWRYRRWPTPARHFQRMHDVLLRYVRDPNVEPRWTQLYEELAESTRATWGDRKQRAVVKDGKRARSESTDAPSVGVAMSDVWEIPVIAPSGGERTGYPTQKPEALLERVVTGCSLPGDTVIDPYAGSGTTMAVAEKLGRRWIGIDASPVAVRVASERMAALRGPLFETRRAGAITGKGAV